MALYHMENQEILIIWTLLIGPKVSMLHRFHCKSSGRTNYAIKLEQNTVITWQLVMNNSDDNKSISLRCTYVWK